MATVPNGASVAEIAAVFGLAATASITEIAGVVGVSPDAPISTYYGRSNTTPPPPSQFSPEPGTYVENGIAGATVILNCTTDAVWTYTRIAGPPNGAGTSVNLASGGTAKAIRFGVAQTNAGGPQSARWTVRGTSGGVTADYDLTLNAEGSGGIN